jgi:hypothetical protein
MTVPSGQKCRVVPLSLQELVFDGIIDDVDAVSKLVDSELIAPKTSTRAKKTAAQVGMDFLKDPNARKAFEIMDKVLVAVIVAPKIYTNPAEGEEPDPSKIYIRNVDLRDKIAIFERVMTGVEKTAQFRA